MMCYRDMTFCGGNNGKCLAFSTCHRALTEEVLAAAKNAQMPIARFINPEQRECYQPPTEKDNDTD